MMLIFIVLLMAVLVVFI